MWLKIESCLMKFLVIRCNYLGILLLTIWVMANDGRTNVSKNNKIHGLNPALVSGHLQHSLLILYTYLELMLLHASVRLLVCVCVGGCVFVFACVCLRERETCRHASNKSVPIFFPFLRNLIFLFLFLSRV